MDIEHLFELRGSEKAVYLADIRLVGVNAENLTKLLSSIIFAFGLLLLLRVFRWASDRLFPGREQERRRFWARQGIQLLGSGLLLIGLASLWFDDPTRLGTALGLISAGLAFALQKVVTAIAGYFVILRGNTFNVGDRIVMGGVRGDVVALGFTQTTIMEMGQPPAVSVADPAMWVGSRQYTGRLVTVSNAKIFDEPVFNYTYSFPYIWEEMKIPISYRANRHAVEELMLEIAGKHTEEISKLGENNLTELERRYAVRRSELTPRVYYRLTDNWLELSVRFIVKDHGIRDVKDAMSRDLLTGLERINEGLASATFEIVGLPELRIERSSQSPRYDPMNNNRDSS